ncbi:MAG: MoaD/ThiS family protein [Verrucomicrobiales bacterium]|nr:MoaD/ThiS family protein [Verrucomicrobiales bacterium]
MNSHGNGLEAQKRVDARSHWVNVAANESMAPNAVTITVHIPGPLRDCCAGAAELALPATSLRAVLEGLEQRHPALHRSVCDETGAVRRHVNLFVNTDHMRDRNGLDTPLAPGDEVTILPAVSGG